MRLSLLLTLALVLLAARRQLQDEPWHCGMQRSSILARVEERLTLNGHSGSETPIRLANSKNTLIGGVQCSADCSFAPSSSQ